MKLRYDIVSFGSEEEQRLPPIIFLHGILENRKMWKKVAPIVSRKTRRKGYVLDARNHGESPKSSDMNFDVLTEDVKEFMDDHHIRKAVLVGNSMGGRTVINFALKHPQRTEAICVGDMTPKNLRTGSATFVAGLFQVAKESLKHLPTDISLDDAKMLLVDILSSMVRSNYFIEDNLRKNFDLDFMPIIKTKDHFEIDANLEALESMLSKNCFVQNLPESNLHYDGHALFLYGSKPFYKIETDTSITKLFPKALKRKIDNTGHLMHLESPEVYAQLVSDFILHRYLPQSKY